MMKRLLFTTLVGLLLVCSVQGAPVSLQRATDVANMFLTNTTISSGVHRAPVRTRLARVSAAKAPYYIFENEEGGFVIVAGDDVAYPILGYSNDATLDAASVPSNVQAWLNQYAAEIKVAVDSGVAQSVEVKKAWESLQSYSNAAVIVSPLILTRWNQSPYYNDLCPMDNSRNERTVVGCVATAMAQVLKYWDYPTQGNGSYSYTHALGQQSADFANTTYDWVNMPLELTASSTDIQKAAVAQLMYHCGVSVEMDYGVSSTGGSGAFTISSKSNSTHCAEYALREYWGYKPTLQGLQKSNYSDKDWKTMLKNDLKAGRPIIYSGYGDGGHCFVCDGYDEDEYFHFNWGWGGLYDGYFKLNALALGTGGIGSGGGSYNNDQQAIFGLEPLKSLDNDETTKELQLASTISISSSEIAYKEGFSISVSVKNTGSTNFNGDLGLALYDSGLELLTVMDAKNTSIAAGGVVDCTFGTTGWSELVAGLYYAAIYSKTATGEWESIGNGTYRNMVQFRIKTDPCAGNTVYECDFEGDLLGWTFAKAPGINSGFAVGSAMKYQGEKALYISPDGGITSAYTQDNDKGYVSVAYKKIYLEAGNYELNCCFWENLSYLDIDNDDMFIGIVPAKNEIKPLDYFDSWPSFIQNNITYFGNWYEPNCWINPSNTGTASESGEYYLLIAFMANESLARENGLIVDNVSINKQHSYNYKETKEGVLFTWSDGYPKYNFRYASGCDWEWIQFEDVGTSILIPWTKLRDAVYNESSYYFEIEGICDNGPTKRINQWMYLKTEPFPLDTCPAVPVDFKAENTAKGITLTWSGNAGMYELKYGTEYNGCNPINNISNIKDTTYTIPYTLSSGLQDGYHYFFVRGICENDTSIWRRVYFEVKGPDASTSDLCYAKPCDFYAQNTAEGIMLTWKGNADKYEIECRSEDEYYKRGDIYEYNDSNYVHFTANESKFVIPYNLLPDTLYHFRVNAICDSDTSFWTDYISAYNINFGDYCIPFYDLCGPNTFCTYGVYWDPYSNTKTLDYRQKDWRDSYITWSNYGYRYGVYGYEGWDYQYYRSRHTICFEGETDPRCDNELTTVPKGEKYSMRLGNWYNGEGESVTFTHKIDSGYPLILLLKYAVVLQDPSHTSAENPHFTLEILDENGVALDPICWYADFAADKNAEGWKNAVNAHEPTNEEFRNVVWKDWTTIGVNLTELSKDGDKIIKIRLTTKDCTRGQHYGYAYFTLSCTSGDMEGVSCGEHPRQFEVAEGFKYRWYLMDDTSKALVCDSNIFVVQPNDTNSYYVDMISLENSDCYYTLSAHTLPRLPRSQATFTHAPHNCINEVMIENTSYVYKIMRDGTEVRDGRVKIDSIQWDFGKYGKSTEVEPQLIVPNKGDTLKVSLRVVANKCVDVQEYTLHIPAIRDTTTYAHRYLCKGETLFYNGKEYYKDGVYVDSLQRAYGCDSVHILTVEYLEPEYKLYYDTICAVDIPYAFFEKQYTKSGVYEEHIQSSLGCDTIIHQLHLLVLDSLQITISDGMEKSRECGEFIVPYTIQKGVMMGYTIDYSDDANANGFVDVVNDTARSTVQVIVPPTCEAKVYQAVIRFHNGDCPALEVPLSFTITLFSKPESKAEFQYDPHDCINQVRITNHSAVYKHYSESKKELDSTQSVDSYLWDLGPYGQSTEITPELIVPQEGDTFVVSLTTTYGAYTHTAEYTLEIPSILEQDGYMYRYICQGESFIYQGQEYAKPGRYVLDRVTSSIGCDSVSYLVVEYLTSEIIEEYDTICFTELPYEFYGQTCRQTGVYEHNIKATGGCDSVTYRMNLIVLEELEVEVNIASDICSGDPSFDVAYSTFRGSSTGFSIQFSQTAKLVGFVDSAGVAEDAGVFTIRLPKDVRPDTYIAEVIFDNHGCEYVKVPLSIPVLYSSNVITQRWNDFLGVKNAQYNGGYVFTDYQWFLNDQPIDGHTATQVYKEGELLDFDGEYRVKLTREDDGKTIMSCPFTPVYYNEEDFIEICTFANRGERVSAKVSRKAVMYLYSTTGVFVAQYDLNEGGNQINMPGVTGLFTAKVVYSNGKTEMIKIIVH